MATRLVGRMEMAGNAGFLSIVASLGPLPTGSANSSTGDRNQQDVADLLSQPGGFMTVFGGEPDGAFSIVDVRGPSRAPDK
jgi:hypothetical protein